MFTLTLLFSSWQYTHDFSGFPGCGRFQAHGPDEPYKPLYQLVILLCRLFRPQKGAVFKSYSYNTRPHGDSRCQKVPVVSAKMCHTPLRSRWDCPTKCAQAVYIRLHSTLMAKYQIIQ